MPSAAKEDSEHEQDEPATWLLVLILKLGMGM